jgi:hypothetical protein
MSSVDRRLKKRKGKKSKYHKLDKRWHESVLEEAISDLKDFGCSFKASKIPIMETWIKLWRENDIFKGFVLARQKGSNKWTRRIFVKTQYRKDNALVIHFKNKLYKERKKIRSEIKVRRKIRRWE